ncbi:hypothetical protein Vau01_113580 [Virgisporangium aurantiacum]|uniref:N-acetyltransferase domain-containing protein n=1 Tax=Virgisporangium aurantiacum TaxID=175570 RepID=A0A8J3ZGS2_9ACTN|nr:hypothetical protein Vau01_113580 [Virgisporangium aurantiacum]
MMPWTDAPAEQLPGNTAAYYWRTRASFSPADWILDLIVRLDGQVVGVQGIHVADYLVVRTGETGSWLGRRFQGRGIGTAMRQVMCALLFDHLDAEEITSAAFTDNPASLAVSRKVGYVDNGTVRVQRRPPEARPVRPLSGRIRRCSGWSRRATVRRWRASMIYCRGHAPRSITSTSSPIPDLTRRGCGHWRPARTRSSATRSPDAHEQTRRRWPLSSPMIWTGGPATASWQLSPAIPTRTGRHS